MEKKTTKKSNKTTKSTKSKKTNKKTGWQKFLAIAVIILAAAWLLGGRPIVELVDGSVIISQTEVPTLAEKIISVAKGESDSSVLFASAAETETSESEQGGQTPSTPEPASSEQRGQPPKVAGSVKSSTGTKGSSQADLGHKENTPLFFGNPSDALANTKSDKNYLMEKPQYTVSYNTETLCPNWVAWHLGTEDMGSADRSDDFRPDTELPEGWYAVTKADYKYNAYGFDRGHVCPSADRTATKEDNSMTFLMTNMMPQSPDNNRVIWMHFENYERQLVKEGNEVYIIAGPYGKGGTTSKGTFDEIPVTTKSGETLHMNVPAYTWKVCLVVPEGTDDLSKITKDTTVIAINVPNKMGMGKTGDWEQFLTSIDEIESLTGYDFFELLPDDIEDALEAKVYQYTK